MLTHVGEKGGEAVAVDERVRELDAQHRAALARGGEVRHHNLEHRVRRVHELAEWAPLEEVARPRRERGGGGHAARAVAREEHALEAEHREPRARVVALHREGGTPSRAAGARQERDDAPGKDGVVQKRAPQGIRHEHRINRLGVKPRPVQSAVLVQLHVNHGERHRTPSEESAAARLTNLALRRRHQTHALDAKRRG